MVRRNHVVHTASRNHDVLSQFLTLAKTSRVSVY